MAQRIRHAEDLRFVQDVLAGNPAARDRFVDRLACVPGILRTKGRRMSLTLGESDLEELTQRTLVAIWGKLQRFEGSSALETWAFGFCTFELMKWRERRGRGLSEESLEGLAEDLQDLDRESRVDGEALDNALEAVGPPATTVIRLKHFEELTFEEIGVRLGSSPNTVKTQYYRGFRKLRELLRPIWERDLA